MVHNMFEMMSSLLYNLMKRFVFHLAITTSSDGHTNRNQDSDLDTVGVSNCQKKIEAIFIIGFCFNKLEMCKTVNFTHLKNGQ